MQPIIVNLGPLKIYGYGLMLVLGFLSGISLARWRARRCGLDPQMVPTVGLLALVAGVLGARAAYVIQHYEAQFAYQPAWELLNITSGGLIFYGGVAAATGVILTYIRVCRLPMRRVLDVIAPSLMLGLAFGRMGCLLNGCCFGGPARAGFPLAAHFRYAVPPLVSLGSGGNIFGDASVSPVFQHQLSRQMPPERGGLDIGSLPPYLLERNALGQAASTERMRAIPVAPADLSPKDAKDVLYHANVYARPVQPAQTLAVINALLVAGLLMAYSRLRKREGQVFLLMLMLYPVLRFVEEGIRDDNPHDLFHLHFTHNQITSMVMIGVGLGLWLLLRHWPAAATGPAPAVAASSRQKGN